MAVDPPVIEGPAEAWSGGRVVLRSSSFDNSTPVLVRLADRTLTSVALDSNRREVYLPDTSGPVELTVRFPGVVDVPFALTVRGFVRVFSGAPIASVLRPVAGSAMLLGSTNSDLLRLDPRTGNASPITGLPAGAHDLLCGSRSFISLQASRVVTSRTVPGGGCMLRVWEAASGIVVDSLYYNFFWAGAWLGQNTWLINNKTFTYRVTPGSAPVQLDNVNQPDEFLPSPSGTRLFPMLGGYNISGTPVYDASLAPAYVLAPFDKLFGLAFAATGDTAFVVARSGPATMRLRAFDPETGTSFGEEDITATGPDRLAAEPAMHWLYLADAEWDGQVRRVAIRVYDRRTLREVAVLRIPAASQQDFTDPYDFVPVIDVAQRKLYLVAASYGPEIATNGAPFHPTTIVEFDLLH